MTRSMPIAIRFPMGMGQNLKAQLLARVLSLRHFKLLLRVIPAMKPIRDITPKVRPTNCCTATLDHELPHYKKP